MGGSRDRQIIALLQVLVENTSALKSLGQLDTATEEVESSFSKLDKATLDNVEKETKSVEKAMDKAQDSAEETRKSILQVFADPGGDEFRDKVRQGVSVFGDIDSSISTLAGAGAELGIISEETEKQLIKVREAFGAVEAGALLAADGMALASKAALALGIGATTMLAAAGAALVGVIALKEAFDFITASSTDSADKFLEEQARTNELREEEARILSEETSVSLEERIRLEELNLKLLDQQIAANRAAQAQEDAGQVGGAILDKLAQVLSDTDLEKFIRAEDDLNKEREKALGVLDLLTDATIRAKIASREFFEGFDIRVAEEIEARRRASASSAELNAELDVLKISFEAGQQVLAEMVEEMAGGASGFSSMAVATGEAAEAIERNQQAQDNLITGIEDVTAFIEAAEARELETAAIERQAAAIERVTAIRERFADATSALSEFESEQLEIRTSAAEEAVRAAERSGLVSALDAEERRAKALIETEKNQAKIANALEQGRENQADIILKNQERFTEINEEFQESQIDAAEEHNKRIIEINKDLNRDLQQAQLDNDVNAFLAAQQQGEDALVDERDSFANRNQEAREAFDESLEDLRRNRARELQANQEAARQRLQQIQDDARNELTFGQRLLQVAQQQKQALLQAFAREDLALVARREQARLNILQSSLQAEVTLSRAGLFRAGGRRTSPLSFQGSRATDSIGRSTAGITVNIGGVGNLVSEDNITDLKRAFTDGLRAARETTR